MAKIQEEIIIIKLSKLHKDSDMPNAGIAGNDIVAGLEQVVQELVGSDIIVEIATDVQ